MEPNFTELAERGRRLFCDLREADDAAHNRRSAAVSVAPTVPPAPPQRPPAQAAGARPAPTAPAATLASFNVFDHRDGRPIGEVKAVGARFVAHDIDGRAVAECHTVLEAMRAVEQAATDAMWTDVIAEQNSAARHATRQTSPTDSNHGWNAIIASVGLEQSASGASDVVGNGWDSVLADMKAKHGLRT